MIILIILKIILIILLIIIGLLLTALIMPVSVKISYTGEKKYYEIKYAFLSLISSDKKKGLLNRLKKPKKKEKKSRETKFRPVPKSESKPEKSEKPGTEPQKEVRAEKEIPSSAEITKETESEPKRKNKEKSIKSESSEKSHLEKISGVWEKITQIWEIASSPVKRICKGIHFDKIYINFKISDPDACECAIDYGKTCIFVYNILSVFNQMFSLTKKSIDVECVFNEKKSVYDIAFTLRFHPIVLVGCGISFLWTYYFKIYKNKSGGKKSGKQGNKKRETHK